MSPSGSVKYPGRSSVVVSPTGTVSVGTTPMATGGRLGTVTANSRVAARPSVSVAVTVTVVLPFAIAVTVAMPWETETPTRAVSAATAR